MRISVDIKSTIEILKDSFCHLRSKHMGIHNKFVKELVEGEILEFQYAPTKMQVADCLITALTHAKMEEGRKQLDNRE